jgi:hypothetical protein
MNNVVTEMNKVVTEIDKSVTEIDNVVTRTNNTVTETNNTVTVIDNTVTVIDNTVTRMNNTVTVMNKVVTEIDNIVTWIDEKNCSIEQQFFKIAPAHCLNKKAQPLQKGQAFPKTYGLRLTANGSTKTDRPKNKPHRKAKPLLQVAAMYFACKTMPAVFIHFSIKNQKNTVTPQAWLKATNTMYLCG